MQCVRLFARVKCCTGCWLMPMFSAPLRRTAASPVVTGHSSHASRSFPRLGRTQCQRGRPTVCVVSSSSFSRLCLSATEPNLGSSAARLTCKGSPSAYSLLVARLAGISASSTEYHMNPCFRRHRGVTSLSIRASTRYSSTLRSAVGPISAHCQLRCLFAATASRSITSHLPPEAIGQL